MDHMGVARQKRELPTPPESVNHSYELPIGTRLYGEVFTGSVCRFHFFEFVRGLHTK